MTSHEFTTRDFVRSHGREPSRTALGSWGFQRTTATSAFDHERFGDIVWVPWSTLAEAKAEVRATQPAGIWSVAP